MSKMAEKFGRIRPEKNMRPAVRKVEVCRIVYFDEKGKFTANPKLAKKVALHPHPRAFRGTSVIDLDGEGKALAYVSFRGQVALVRIKDPALEQAKAGARAAGDKALLREIEGYESTLKKMAAGEALKKRKELSEAAQTRREALILAKKASKTQAAKKAALSDEEKKQAGKPTSSPRPDN